MTPKQWASNVVLANARHWRSTMPSGGDIVVADKLALLIESAIRTAAVEAAEEEREACARIAEAQCDVYNIGFCIASDIRARGDGPS